MKKIFIILIAMIATVCANAQTNYAGSSKFTDNISVTVQGGIITSFDEFATGKTAFAPIAVVGADKYINPWFGVGLEGRTLIGTGDGKFDTHTTFDAVNVSGYAKFNVLNMFNFIGKRRTFEPIVYTGFGWGHQTCSNAADRNYMTFRSGVEFNINIGKQKHFGIVINPSVVFGNIDNGKLNKHNGYFELTAGVVYHFNTSNGTTSFAKAKLYNQNEVNELNSKINTLVNEMNTANRTIDSLNRIPKQIVTETVVKTVWPKIQFKQGSAELTETSAANIYDIADNIKDTKDTIKITGYASIEGNSILNDKLSYKRAEAVKTALVNAGVNPEQIITVGKGATNMFSPDDLELNRVVVTEK